MSGTAVTPSLGADGAALRTDQGSNSSPPGRGGLTGSQVLQAINPPPGLFGTAMHCKTPELLAAVLAPMIARRLGKDPDSITDILQKYLSSHGIENDLALSSVHDCLPNPKANEGDQGNTTLTLPSFRELVKLAKGVHSAVENTMFLQPSTSYDEVLKFIGAKAHPGNISGAQALSQSNSSTVSFSSTSRGMPKVTVPKYKNFEPDESEQYLNAVISAFEIEGTGNYLTDPSLSAKNPEIAKAFCARIISSFTDSTTAAFLKVKWAHVSDASVLWDMMLKHFKHPHHQRSARGKLWDRILKLECTDITDFQRWYNDINEIVDKLTNLNSVAVHDEELLCSFVARGLNVEELREEHKKFLKPSSASFSSMLTTLLEDYRAMIGLSEDGVASGPGNNARSSRRAKADANTASMPPFPKNTGNACDPRVYAQLKKFYSLAIKPDRSSAEQTELDTFALRPTTTKTDHKSSRGGGGKDYKKRSDSRQTDRRGGGGYGKDYNKKRSDDRRDNYRNDNRRTRRGHRGDRSYSRSYDRTDSRRSHSRSRSRSRDRRSRSRSRSRSIHRDATPPRTSRRGHRGDSPSKDGDSRLKPPRSKRTMFGGKTDPDKGRSTGSTSSNRK